MSSLQLWVSVPVQVQLTVHLWICELEVPLAVRSHRLSWDRVSA